MNVRRATATIWADMRNRLPFLATLTALAPLALSAVALSPLAGCETPAVSPGSDAGPSASDAGPSLADGGAVDAPRMRPDGGPRCATDADCDDGGPDARGVGQACSCRWAVSE